MASRPFAVPPRPLRALAALALASALAPASASATGLSPNRPTLGAPAYDDGRGVLVVPFRGPSPALSIRTDRRGRRVVVTIQAEGGVQGIGAISGNRAWRGWALRRGPGRTMILTIDAGREGGIAIAHERHDDRLVIRPVEPAGALPKPPPRPRSAVSYDPARHAVIVPYAGSPPTIAVEAIGRPPTALVALEGLDRAVAAAEAEGLTPGDPRLAGWMAVPGGDGRLRVVLTLRRPAGVRPHVDPRARVVVIAVAGATDAPSGVASGSPSPPPPTIAPPRPTPPPPAPATPKPTTPAPTATPSPTPSPAPTPSPNPTPSSPPTPSPTSTPTPTPTPSPTAEPSAPAGLPPAGGAPVTTRIAMPWLGRRGGAGAAAFPALTGEATLGDTTGWHGVAGLALVADAAAPAVQAPLGWADVAVRHGLALGPLELGAGVGWFARAPVPAASPGIPVPLLHGPEVGARARWRTVPLAVVGRPVRLGLTLDGAWAPYALAGLAAPAGAGRLRFDAALAAETGAASLNLGWRRWELTGAWAEVLEGPYVGLGFHGPRPTP